MTECLMRNSLEKLLILLLVSTLPGWAVAQSGKPDGLELAQQEAAAARPQYATGYSVSSGPGYILATVRLHDRTVRYGLIDQKSPLDSVPGADVIIRTPVRRVAALSTTYIPSMDALGELDSLVAIDSDKWVYSPEVRSAARNGRIAVVGSGPSVNIERLLTLQPQLIMTYTGTATAWDSYPQLKEAGLPVVLNGDFLENTPLGRSEWIKFIGLFFQKASQAEEIFAGIAARYQRLAARARESEKQPEVFLNIPWGGNWAMPGGNNYSAVFLRDAGADYLWSDTETSSTLFLDFESVFARANDAEFWLNPGMWERLSDVARADRRFTRFRAYRLGNIYNNNRRSTPSGGSDYFESGYLYADRVLADLVKIFHPELVPEHRFYYYRRLSQ